MRGDSRMLDLLIQTITINYRNLRLREVIDHNQREIIYRLSEVVETRSKETGLHVKRVSLYCELIAKLLGLPRPSWICSSAQRLSMTSARSASLTGSSTSPASSILTSGPS